MAKDGKNHVASHYVLHHVRNVSHLSIILASIGSGSCTGDSIKSYDGANYGPYYGFSCAHVQGEFTDSSV